MYTRLKSSLISPRNIPNLINNKKMNRLYLLLLTIVFVLPYVLTVITSYSSVIFLGLIEEAKNVELNYVIENNELRQFDINGREYSFVEDDYFSVIFTIEDLKNSTNTISSALTENTLNSQVTFVYGKTNIYILMVLTKTEFMLFDIASYADLDLPTLTINNMKDVSCQNDFLKLNNSLYNKYSGLILGIGIPTLIIAGITSLLFTILLPAFITYLFYKKYDIRFKEIFAMGIYAFTPYVISTLMVFGLAAGTLTVFAELLSLIYLFIALNAKLVNRGGFKNEL